MPNDSRAYLFIARWDLDPADVSAAIGREPTRSYVRGGTPYDLSPRAADHGAWMLDSPAPRSAHLDTHVEALLDLLAPYADGVRRVAERYEAGINCVAYYADWTPGIHLTPETVRRAADLGLSFDFDLYFLGERDAPT